MFPIKFLKIGFHISLILTGVSLIVMTIIYYLMAYNRPDQVSCQVDSCSNDTMILSYSDDAKNLTNTFDFNCVEYIHSNYCYCYIVDDNIVLNLPNDISKILIIFFSIDVTLTISMMLFGILYRLMKDRYNMNNYLAAKIELQHDLNSNERSHNGVKLDEV